MKKRTIAIVTSVAALSFAAAPIAAAATSHAVAKPDRLEHVRDARADRSGTDRSRDAAGIDRSHDTSSRDQSPDR